MANSGSERGGRGRKETRDKRRKKIFIIDTHAVKGGGEIFLNCCRPAAALLL
jgi:hypothetical protein